MIEFNKDLQLTPTDLLKYSRMECTRLKRRIGEMQSEIDELKYTNAQIKKQLGKMANIGNNKELLDKRVRSCRRKIMGVSKYVSDMLGKVTMELIIDKPKIVCIVGDSGSGKTTLAEYLEKEHGIPQIVSYTTRPMREGEEQGKEHIFVDEYPYKNADENILAHTFFGGYDYWTTADQLENDTQVYVIDESGLLFLKQKADMYGFGILSVYIKREECDAENSVGAERVRRDDERKKLPITFYDAVIENKGTLKDFLVDAAETISGMITK